MTDTEVHNEMAPVPAAYEAPAQHDYFGFVSSEKFYFPDGVTWLEFDVMNEGRKTQFQKQTQRDLVLERQSGNARMKVDPGVERHELIRQSVKNWNLVRGAQNTPIEYNPKSLRDFLELADPKMIEDIEKAIRKANPWLMAEMTVKDIDREIDSLQEMRTVAEEREKNEVFSPSK